MTTKTHKQIKVYDFVHIDRYSCDSVLSFTLSFHVRISVWMFLQDDVSCSTSGLQENNNYENVLILSY